MNAKFEIGYLIFVIWLVMIIIWNFGVPTAAPIYDVLVSLVLSLVVIAANHHFKAFHHK